MRQPDPERLQAAVKQLLDALGYDHDTAELRETPQLVATALQEMTAGEHQDPLAILSQTIPAEKLSQQFVAVTKIVFTSVCQHHLLPFTGVAHVVYLPENRLAGFGTIARAVTALAARLQLQENLCRQIAEAISVALEAAGVLVVLEARHGCLSDRGAKAQQAHAVTKYGTGKLASTDAAHLAALKTLELALKEAL